MTQRTIKRRIRGGGDLMRRAYRTSFAVGLLVHLAAPAAWAQAPGRLPNEDSGYLQWGIALGAAVVVLLSAFLNPKRSHLS